MVYRKPARPNRYVNPIEAARNVFLAALNHPPHPSNRYAERLNALLEAGLDDAYGFRTSLDDSSWFRLAEAFVRDEPPPRNLACRPMTELTDLLSTMGEVSGHHEALSRTEKIGLARDTAPMPFGINSRMQFGLPTGRASES